MFEKSQFIEAILTSKNWLVLLQQLLILLNGIFGLFRLLEKVLLLGPVGQNGKSGPVEIILLELDVCDHLLVIGIDFLLRLKPQISDLLIDWHYIL